MTLKEKFDVQCKEAIDAQEGARLDMLMTLEGGLHDMLAEMKTLMNLFDKCDSMAQELPRPISMQNKTIEH